MTMDTTLQAPSGAGSRPLAQVRPFLWSVRREVWENRSTLIAPAVGAAVVLVGFLLGLLGAYRAQVSTFAAHDNTISGHHMDIGAMLRIVPYEALAMIAFIVAFVAAAIYCMGALNGERRDRSILFWKSLPVSDLIAVGAKAMMPLVIVPLVLIVVIVVFQAVLLLASVIILAMTGGGVASSLVRFPLLSNLPVIVWGAFSQTLWRAPVWGWLLLVSAWAKRAPVLWALGIPFGLSILEKLALGSDVVGHFVGTRVFGGFSQAFLGGPHMAGSFPTPTIAAAQFFSSPDLWFGLVLGAALFAGAVWLRRTREPV